MCEKCIENQNGVCQSITCDWYNVPIIDIDETFCIHQVVERNYDEEDGLFD